MDSGKSSVDRPSDQEIKDRQDAELDAERKARAERLGHDIRDIQETRGPSQNDLSALTE